MASPDRTLLTEADVTSPSSKLGETVSGVRNRLGVVEVATGTQYGNVPTLTDVTEIPTDVSGRIDLVYTQPTTVHFDAPGLTDIVLSIEGYEHITWEGVSVHGLPDATGVVWASAMWRDRDSTWHLLCEQDPSDGGAGGVSISMGEFPTATYAPVGEADWAAQKLLGGTASRPARTVASNGAVTHEHKASLPASILAVVPQAATSRIPYGIAKFQNLDNGSIEERLTNYPARTTSEEAFHYAMGWGMVMFEYGTIATPGGQGYRLSIHSLSDFDFDAKTVHVVGSVEITQNPLSFGVSDTTSLAEVTAPNIIPALPSGHRYAFSIKITLPGQTSLWSPSLLSAPTPNPVAMRVGLRSSHIPNPIPSPTVDSNGFAIHKVDFDQTCNLSITEPL